MNNIRQGSHGTQITMQHNTLFNSQNKNYNNNFNNTINKPNNSLNSSDLLNSQKDLDVNIKNNNLKQNFNNNFNNNYSNVPTKKKFNHNRVDSDLRYGYGYNNNPGTKNEDFYKSEHVSVLGKANDLNYNSNDHGLNKYDNEFNIKNYQNVNKDKINENLNDTINIPSGGKFSKNEKIARFKWNINEDVSEEPVEINQNLDINYYLNAALNLNSENRSQNEIKIQNCNDKEMKASNTLDKREYINSEESDSFNINEAYHGNIEDNYDKSNERLRGSSKSFLSQDLKELVDGIKKNKDKIKKQKNSIHSCCDATKSSENDSRSESFHTTRDRDKREVINISLTIGPEENSEKSRMEEKQDSLSYDLPFAKIPNNLLNAKSYGDYFFNQNAGRDINSNNKSQNQTKVCSLIFIIIGYLRKYEYEYEHEYEYENES